MFTSDIVGSDLNQNYIKSVPPYAFQNSSTLQVIILFANPITIVLPDAFANLPALQYMFEMFILSLYPLR